MAEEAPNAATHDLAANLEEDSEGLYEANEWLRSAPKIKPKLFAFDWSHGTSFWLLLIPFSTHSDWLLFNS